MPRSFAIVPAAGQSSRMGAPKLLLPLGGRALIQHVLAAWTAAVDHVVVVVRGDDRRLVDACQGFGVDLLLPEPSPPDMKASIQAGLRHIEASYAPHATDICLVAPADLPRLTSDAIRRVMDAHVPSQPTAIVPVFAGVRGHPVLLPWSWTPAVFELAPHEGLNSLLKRVPVKEAACNDPSSFEDIDEKGDYVRLITLQG